MRGWGYLDKTKKAREIETDEQLKKIQEVLASLVQDVKKTALNEDIQKLINEIKDLKMEIKDLKEKKQGNTIEVKNSVPITTEEKKEEEIQIMEEGMEKDGVTFVPPEIFDTMITNSGFSISDFCKMGTNVLLVFANTVGLKF
jgi:regulator of replication initiation timing